jgi:hypothetical protein
MGAHPTIRKMLGTFIPDEDPSKKSPLLQWTQQECRQGSLAATVKQFVECQAEDLDTRYVLVDSVQADGLLRCRLPAKLTDHESPTSFRLDISFSLNPATKQTIRLDEPRLP